MRSLFLGQQAYLRHTPSVAFQSATIVLELKFFSVSQLDYMPAANSFFDQVGTVRPITRVAGSDTGS